MLYLLLVLLLFLLFVSYKLFKEFLSPSFLLCGLFVICNIFAILGNLNWKIAISPKVVLVMFFGLASIMCGEYVGRRIVAKKVVNIKNPALIDQSENNIIESINVPRLITIIVSIASVVILYFQYNSTLSMAISHGWTESSTASFIGYARSAMLISGASHGYILSFFLFFLRMVGFVYSYLLINNIVSKPSIKMVANNGLCLIPIVCTFICLVLGTGRNDFLMYAVFVFFILFSLLNKKYKKIKWKFFIGIGISILIIFFIVFSFLGSDRGFDNDSALSVIYVYAGSSIVALDMWLNGNISNISTIFGAETFTGIYGLIQIFNSSFLAPSYFLEFVQFANGQSTNIYTGFRAFIADFGYIGLIIGSFILGFAYGVFFIKVRDSFEKNNNLSLPIILYGYFLYYFIYFLFVPVATTMLLSMTQILDVFWLIFIYFIVTNFKYAQKNYNKKRKYIIINNNTRLIK